VNSSPTIPMTRAGIGSDQVRVPLYPDLVTSTPSGHGPDPIMNGSVSSSVSGTYSMYSMLMGRVFSPKTHALPIAGMSGSSPCRVWGRCHKFLLWLTNITT